MAKVPGPVENRFEVDVYNHIISSLFFLHPPPLVYKSAQQIRHVSAKSCTAPLPAEVFASLAKKRSHLERRTGTLTAHQQAKGTAIPTDTADIYAQMIDDVQEALHASELTPVERRQAILPIVDYLMPEEDGVNIFLH